MVLGLPWDGREAVQLMRHLVSLLLAAGFVPGSMHATAVLGAGWC